MRQVWIPQRGAPEVLEVREAPDPEPDEGEVRVRVEAAGVNFADILARMGLYPDCPPLPTVVGYEVAGTVDGLGEGVSEPAEGTRVLAPTRFGGYADVVCVPAEQATSIPDDLSFTDAAAIPVNYLTAWLMLVHLGNVREGDRVLVHAAAGGVGQAAVQIGRWRGAEIFGTASAPKHDRLREMGVAHPIDYRNEDFEEEIARITDGRGVDIALDAIGGESFAKSYRSLDKLGRLYLFGNSSMAQSKRRSILRALWSLWKMPTFKPVPLMEENRGVQGVNLGDLWDRQDLLRGMMEAILERVVAGDLAPVVDETFPLEETGKAHAYIQDRKNFGKVILTT